MEQLMREAMSSLNPPTDLHGRILAAVAKEKRRVRLQAVYRRVGVVAAAVLILVPAVTLPIFRQAYESSAPVEAPAPAEDLSPAEDDAVHLTEGTADITVTAAAAAEETAKETDLLFAAVGNTAAESAAPSPAQPDADVLPPPDYVSRPMMSTGPTDSEAPPVATMAVQTTADTAEPAYFAILRALVGEEAFALWLSAYEGDPASKEAEAAAYAYFGMDS